MFIILGGKFLPLQWRGGGRKGERSDTSQFYHPAPKELSTATPKIFLLKIILLKKTHLIRVT